MINCHPTEAIPVKVKVLEPRRVEHGGVLRVPGERRAPPGYGGASRETRLSYKSGETFLSFFSWELNPELPQITIKPGSNPRS